MILTKEEAVAIAERIFSFSKADAVRVNVNGGQTANLRFARNTVSTSGTSGNVSISIDSSFGKKTGSYNVNQFDDASLREAVRIAEDLARLAPEDPEYMEPLGAQSYADVKAAFTETKEITPEFRARIAGECIGMAKPKQLTAAGFIENGENFSFFATSKGLTAYHTDTSVSYSVTVRSDDGTGSGWADGGDNNAAGMDSAAISARAVTKALTSMNPRTVEPGTYTVILEPEAVSNLLGTFSFRMDARSADEGRSYFSEAGGKNKIGQQLFPEFVSIYTDPTHPEVPGFPWSEDGIPARKTIWVEKGVLKNLRYSRFWAQKQGKEAVPFPSNIIFEGGTSSVDELISTTERGILVTRFWYIRDVDPKTMLLTGLTRDGTFWIENGKISHPIKNFRFNESPVAMLKNIEMMSKPVRRQQGGSANLVPALKVKDFTFSSLSDAV